MEAVYIVSAGRIQRLGRSFVVVGLGSVQRFPGVKERVQCTIFEEALVVCRSSE